MAATIACPTLDVPARRTAVVPARVASAQAAPSEAHGALGLGGLRLTRRGRVVVFALALMVSLPLAGVGGRAMASDPGRPVEVTVHTVAPGETLWQLARHVAEPGQDVRDVVADLRDLNELESVALTVGQSVLLPRD
ncbi:LysM peptidoglycan-binding domain-containing protein [Xylanimonas ulmi]|uniref:LysM domain-containing protein n=1 Tax=Xylanimonas ulmi TaxID=228973 RepID=A0A4Q7M2Z0_9MICO|nr:LysM peptidoglycan-binding domain-containing protein [Xylanibacterium ulmi]RZS61313.1 LysM domain-containing protein [Xylanibacterium ulmi]